MSEIDTDLPEHWPRAGDRLFVQTSWGLDANLSTFPGERLYRMKVTTHPLYLYPPRSFPFVNTPG